MSSVYVLEPPTVGKVVLRTTDGPLDIELWPKEAPKAVRNFVQLCVDGYYNNTSFHRIIKGFMVQGGDASCAGTGGKSIYGAPFADEFHSRLRFSHRGLIACANAGTPNSNNSQFFITLDRCEWLERKNTIFGKVTGDTVYNLLKLGDVETDKDDKPVDPIPMILSVEVLWNPFDDIVPTRAPIVNEEEAATKKKAKKVKQLNLLSFGEEAEEEEQELAISNVKIKSSHDVLDDPRLLKGDGSNAEADPYKEKGIKNLQLSVREALISRKKGEDADDRQNSLDDEGDDVSDEDFDVLMRRQALEKQRKFGKGHEPVKNRKSDRVADSGALKVHVESPPRDQEDSSIKRDRLSLKKKGLGSEARAKMFIRAEVDAQLLGPQEQQRHINKQKKRARQGREEATLERLQRFKNTLVKAKEASSEEEPKLGAPDVDDDSGWLAHRLEFAPDPGRKDNMAKNDDIDQYVVHDPLLEKGKEKFNKMQARMKRKEREWAGKSIT